MTSQYSMLIIWSPEDEAYLVHLPEFNFQKFHTHGQTYEEAAKKGQEAIESLVDWYEEEGKSLPDPQLPPSFKVA
ncbi:MAG: type II toxin-antitoxin system HicB family antitoxin [Cyanobacteria bacterium P01_A01_bin.123]